MRNLFPSSIRSKLILLGVLAFLPVVLLTVFNSWYQRRLEVAVAKERMVKILDFAILHEEEVIRETHRILATLAEVPIVRKGGNHANEFLARLLRNSPEYVNFGVIRPDGQAISSAVPLKAPLNFSDRPYFQDALKNKSFSIGQYQVGRIVGKPTINFGYPVIDGKGKVAAVVFAALNLSYVSKIEHGIVVQAPSNSTYVTLDQNGAVLTSYPASQLFGRGHPLERSFFERISKEKKGTFQAVGADGVERLNLFSPFRGPLNKEGGYALLGIPTKALFAEVNRLLAMNLAVLSMVGVLFLAIMWFGGNALIIRPVGILTDASKRLAGGDLTARTGLSPTLGELGYLSGTFDKMAEELERRQNESLRMQEQISEVRTRFTSILAASPAIIYACRIPGAEDSEKKYTPIFVSDKMTERFGYEIREVLENSAWWEENVYPEDLPQARIQRILFEQGTMSREYRFRDKGGSWRWVLDQLVLVKNLEGTPIEFVGSWTDITDRKQAEENLSRSQRLESVGRLAGGIAHDFNNLLTAILGYSEILNLRFPAGDPSHMQIEEIQKAAERAAGLTRQLLAFSRKQILQPRVISINSVVSEMDRMLRRLLGEDIDIVTKMDDGLWNVRADPGQIEQVVMNLAVNGRDAMTGGGKLTIETSNVFLEEEYSRGHLPTQPGPYVMLAVSDTGVGMDEGTMSKIFEPFFTTKELGKGTGLGLSTVYGIVKQSGGYIWAYSEPGRGSTFKVYLPRTEDREDVPHEAVSPVEDFRGEKTVLVVEDDQSIRKLAVEILDRYGYSVISAGDGEEALRVAGAHEGEISLLLTDVVMPRIGGRELYERIRQQRPEIKVLYMSGYTDNAIVHQGVLGPGTAFLQKPYTPISLARKVKEVLETPG